MLRNPPRRLAILALAIAVLPPVAAHAQDAMHPEPPEYELQPAGPRPRVLKERIDPRWRADSGGFSYRNDLDDGRREFVAVDALKGERAPAFDHAKIAAAIARETKADAKGDRLPFESFAVDDSGAIRFAIDKQGWRYDPKADTLEKADPPTIADLPARIGNLVRGGGRGIQGTPRRVRSPDGKWSVVAGDSNLVLIKAEGRKEFRLTTDGTPEDPYEGGVAWAPDSSRFVALRTARAQDHPVFFVESSPRTQTQPRLQQHQYLKPGDRIAHPRPHLFDVTTKEEIPVKDDLFPNPWSLDRIRWAADSSRFTFLYNQRGHQVLRLVAVDARTGEARALIDEQSKTFLDYSNKTFCEFLDRTGEILWMSERSGWNHLYRIDAQTGAVKNHVTSGEWVVRGVDRVDEEAGTVEFRAMGLHPGQDPYHVHFARAQLDGSGLIAITRGDGTHTLQYSPDRKYVVDTYSRVDLPPVHELRKAEDGSLVCALEKADVSALESSGWRPPERFSAKGRDGTTEIFGIIVRPSKFDPKRKYPVLEQIYAGPHGAHVPKAFSARAGTRGMADLGFLLVQIDGMGTNWRSKAFHDVCWKNIKDAGFPDRIAWMKAAAGKYPEFDLDRVGVYGGSAGGQNAMAALLFHNDFYKVAAADCGCHDNRMDKIWWNEAWMGWPVDRAYEESSNVVNAHKLKGKLLLTVGELDHNVDPASTMQVVNALIKADKPFELIVFPGADHGAGGSPYGRRRMREFFAKNLGDPGGDEAREGAAGGP